MQNEYNSSFKDQQGKSWTILLTLKNVSQFCGEYNLRLEQVSPEKLNFKQMLRLIYLGVSHHTEIKRTDEEIFLEENIGIGKTLDDAANALAYAIVNFTLPRLTEAQKVLMRKKISETEAEVKEDTEDKEKANAGNGKMQ